MAGNLKNEQNKWILKQYWKTENSERVRKQWIQFILETCQEIDADQNLCSRVSISMRSLKKSLTSMIEPKSLTKNDLSNLDINDDIHTDIEISSTTLKTLEIMKICRKRIIYPFNIMLMMVGWRPFGSQMYHSNGTQKCISILNIFILIILVGLVLFSYSYQILTCRFVMSPEDLIIPTKSPANISQKWFTMAPAIHCPNVKNLVMCKHVYTTYVIPDIIHFVAYIIGIIYYRFRRNEDIYGLMEKALQYSTSLEQNKKSQYKVTTILTMWLVSAVIWVILSVINHIMYDISYNTFSYPFYNINICKSDGINENLGKFLFIMDFCGFVIISIVVTMILLNYAIYCELVKFYIDAINKKIEMRCIKLNVIRNDIHTISIAVDLINSTTGSMTTLIYISTMSLFVGGLNILFSLKMTSEYLKLVFRAYFVLHLMPLIIMPLVQCVRVNNAINRFKDWAMHMSVFGYRKESKKDLDSFLLYTIGYKYKVRLLFIPLQWHQLAALTIFFGFIMVSMIQAGLLSNLRFVGSL